MANQLFHLVEKQRCHGQIEFKYYLIAKCLLALKTTHVTSLLC